MSKDNFFKFIKTAKQNTIDFCNDFQRPLFADENNELLIFPCTNGSNEFTIKIEHYFFNFSQEERQFCLNRVISILFENDYMSDFINILDGIKKSDSEGNNFSYNSFEYPFDTHWAALEETINQNDFFLKAAEPLYKRKEEFMNKNNLKPTYDNDWATTNAQIKSRYFTLIFNFLMLLYDIAATYKLNFSNVNSRINDIFKLLNKPILSDNKFKLDKRNNKQRGNATRKRRRKTTPLTSLR